MAGSVGELVREQLLRGAAVVEAMAADPQMVASIEAAAAAITGSLGRGNKLLVAGNGGSAADAQHMVAEFVSRLCVDRPTMRAVALTVDTSILTAISNDYGFEHVFSRQLEALGQTGDVLIGISTSGNSANILAALERAREQGIVTVGLTGRDGGRMRRCCDHLIAVPSTVTMYVQQAHLAVEHLLCLLVEQATFGGPVASASLAATERDGNGR